VTFAHGQTFPGTGTIAGVTPGTGLTGGGKSGSVTLNVNEGVVAFQSDLKNAENILKGSISTAEANAISASESYANVNFLALSGGTLNGSLAIQGAIPINSQPPPVLSVAGTNINEGLGFSGQAINLTAGNGDNSDLEGGGTQPGGAGGTVNVTAGSGGPANSTGGAGGTINLIAGPGGLSNSSGGGNGGTINLTAGLGGGSDVGGGNGGQIILQPGAGGSSGSGLPNGTPGNVLIVGDDNGTARGIPEQLIIEGSSNANKQLLIGYLADGGADIGYGALQATFENKKNTPLLLNPDGGGVGIGTGTLQLSGLNSLTIGRGQGPALADSWATYSSRRWKTNIKTLPDALDKVERLRGVSYDLKANGKHEIGVIAEEVGAVVPEIVEWDKNGKDANGVDYSRLTALLIEAVKQQQAQIKQHQALIHKQREQMRMQQAQLNAQQTKSKLQDAQITELLSQIKVIQASLKANRRTGSEARTVKAHVSALTD
jgi:hypothetical protein